MDMTMINRAELEALRAENAEMKDILRHIPTDLDEYQWEGPDQIAGRIIKIVGEDYIGRGSYPRGY